MVGIDNRLQNWIGRLNLFNSGSLDTETLQIERKSSWIYVVLFITILGFLSVFTALQRQTTTETVNNPSRATFEDLQQQYPTTLHCPCSLTSIQLSTFVQAHVTFHQICSSSFITDEWIVASFKTKTSDMWPMDARTVASSYAQGLRFLCEASQISLNTEIENALNSFMVSPEALSIVALDEIIHSAMKNLLEISSESLTTASIGFSYGVSNEMAISALGTSGAIYSPSKTSTMASRAINTYRMLDGSLCYCLPTRTCVASAAIYSSTASETRSILSIDANETFVRGMRTDCYPFDGLLASTLECYYDSACLQLLVSNITVFKTLNFISSSRYSSDSTVSSLLRTAMTEEFSYNTSTEAYYRQCAPRLCVYSYEHRSTLLNIITTIVRVVNGLNTGLRFAVPFLVRLLIKLGRKRRLSSATQSTTVTPVGTPGKKSDTADSFSLPSRLIITLERRNIHAGLSFTGLALKQKVLELCRKVKLINLFSSHKIDETVIHRERKITRLYVSLLVGTTVILAFYTALSEKINVHVVTNPVQEEYLILQAKYSDVLECPCASTTFRYSDVLQIRPTFHQICSSGFVNPLFIAQLATFDTTNTNQYDFMAMSGVYFIQIALYCQIVEKSVTRAYEEYLYEDFPKSKLLSPSRFEEQLRSEVMSKSVFIKTYVYHACLEVLQFSSRAYSISALYNYVSLDVTVDEGIRTQPSHFFNCSCITNPDTCSTDAAFYAYTSSNDSLTALFKVPGLQLACSPTRSTLMSSFACWYSSECYEQVISFWRNRTTTFFSIPSLLNASVNQLFNSSDTLTEIIREAMIDQLSVQPSYSAFFTKCAASRCTYPLHGRQNIVLIMISLISICGGLIVALRLVTPFLFHIVFWSGKLIHDRVRIRLLIRQVPQQLMQLNFFFHWQKSSPSTLPTEQRTTRLYIIIWVSVFMTFFLYNFLAEETNTVEIAQPTELIFSQLYASYNTSLICPCTTGRFSFESFLNLSVRLHQICSSPFINDAWIANIFGDGDWSHLPANQFRTRGAVYFVVQQSICSIAQRAVDLSILKLLADANFNAQVLPRDQLLSQSELAVQTAQNWNRDHFRLTLGMVRGGIQTNQLLHVFFSNWIYLPQTQANLSNYRFLPTPVSHGINCSCDISSACYEPVYAGSSALSGFVLGCNPIESLLRSTLSCLYDQTCIQLINFGNLSSIDPLVRSLPSQYYSNSTVDELASGAFVEEWSMNVSYSKFFSACAPTMCTYTVSERRSIRDVITIVLGLYGGLTFTLRAVIPRLVNSLQQTSLFTFQRHSDRVIPFSSNQLKY